MRYSMLLFLAIIGIACAGGNRAGSVTVAAAADDLQVQSPATTIQSFTTVDGADLMARLEAAQSRARDKQTPYWSAYSFDVRPGVGVDPSIRDFNGNMHTMGDMTVFIGTNAAGVTVETRNLAIFLLRGPAEVMRWGGGAFHLKLTLVVILIGVFGYSQGVAKKVRLAGGGPLMAKLPKLGLISLCLSVAIVAAAVAAFK